MDDEQIFEIPPQSSSTDTANWDDKAFTIQRPSTVNPGTTEEHLAVMRPTSENDPFDDE